MRAFFLIFLLLPGTMLAQVIDLRGQWKFHIDDKPGWAAVDVDDATWETIFCPSPWEEEGFHGYDGFAWYRRTFDGKQLNPEEIYYLGLGFIDDCDEVFVNGKLVGFSGSMPPRFKTAYNKERKYPLPSDVINFNGQNTIAIRVFDATLGGGIMDGRLGIYRSQKNKTMVADLQGIWSFAPARHGQRPTKESEWERIMVPGAWEFQGHPKYDGFAWYKRSVVIPPSVPKENLVLLLGRIDDFDQVYFNGILIGSTNDGRPFGTSGSYARQRAYDIPASAWKKDGVNLLEVLVEDMGNIGGIYEGTIGIVTKANYLRHYRE